MLHRKFSIDFIELSFKIVLYKMKLDCACMLKEKSF